MKRFLVFLAVIVALAIPQAAYAQIASDDYLTIRPLSQDEANTLNLSRNLLIGSGCSLVLTGVCAVGTAAYHIEYKEAANKDYFDAARFDKKTRDTFLAGAAVGACATVGLLWGSFAVKKKLSDRVVIKGVTGGFVIEF